VAMTTSNLKVNDMHAFIFGIEKCGGLASVVENLQKDVTDLRQWKIQVAAIGSAIATAFGILGSKIGIMWFGKG
jgi:hypothetical protein